MSMYCYARRGAPAALGCAHPLMSLQILLKEKDFVDGPWSQTSIEAGACRLIPVVQGGVIVKPTRPPCPL